MSRLDRLIDELCPNGVEYLTLKECAKISRGVRVVKNQLKDTGIFPVYQNSLTPLGYYYESNFNAHTTFLIAAGAAGEIGYSYVDFWAADDCFCFECHDYLLNRFLYYVLLNQQSFIYSRVRKASIPRLSRLVIEKILIPVPPLQIQSEIVHILDNFTELTAELTAREKQYEYYRDLILKFDNTDEQTGGLNVKWVSLNDVIISLNTGLNPRRFFKLNTDDATNYYITIRELRDGYIVPSEKTDRINDEALRLCNNRSNLEVGDVLFSGTGTIGETAVINEKPTNWNIKEGVYTIKPDQTKILPYYLRYLLTTGSIKTSYMKKVAGGTVKSIPMAELRKLIIPVPPLEEQARLVSLVEKFDKLCSDISIGLPAEIEARQKQYEYYREKLLSFKELKAQEAKDGF